VSWSKAFLCSVLFLWICILMKVFSLWINIYVEREIFGFFSLLGNSTRQSTSIKLIREPQFSNYQFEPFISAVCYIFSLLWPIGGFMFLWKYILNSVSSEVTSSTSLIHSICVFVKQNICESSKSSWPLDIPNVIFLVFCFKTNLLWLIMVWKGMLHKNNRSVLKWFNSLFTLQNLSTHCKAETLKG